MINNIELLLQDILWIVTMIGVILAFQLILDLFYMLKDYLWTKKKS